MISGVVTLALFRYMYKKGICSDDVVETEAGNDTDHKLGFKESLLYVWRSKYLLCLATIVVTYNIVINLAEVLWKHQVKALYSDPNSYNQYMNEVTILIGVIATLSSLLVSSNGIRKRGWTWTAMITPVILGITSLLFFGSFFLKEYYFKGALDLLPLIVMFGSMQNVLSRGAKYSVFDATKEVAFVPLGADSKLKGKAAIDGVGSRLGKSGGSLLQQGLFIGFGGLMGSTPIIALLLFGMIAIWITSVKSLGNQFNALDSGENKRKPVAEEGLTESRAF
jgi:AAA family ATP:ADP antiporter